MSVMYEDIDAEGRGRKVMLATPVYDRPHPAYTFSMSRTRGYLHGAGIDTHYLLMVGNPHIDDARNEIAHRFLHSDCEYLIFIDADVSWEPEKLLDLVEPNFGIIGGVYPYRREDKQDNMPVRLLRGATPKDGFLEVEGLPTGFMCIRRDVVEKLAASAKTYPAKTGEPVAILFERTLEGQTRYGGDITFCRKWRAMGGQVHAAYEMTLTHAGNFTSSLASYVRAQEKSTLRHVCDKVREGTETLEDISEARRYLDNRWGACDDLLFVAIAFARKADGAILEAGSGLSTILMAAATDEMVYCLEHDNLHAHKLVRMAKEAGVENIGLCTQDILDGWYDIADLDIPKHFAFALVDGPPRTFLDGNSRLKLFDHYSADMAIIDDADEARYREAIEALGKVTYVTPRTAVLEPYNSKREAA